MKFDLINLLVAVAAFGLSGWVFAHQLNEERNTATAAQERMLFGSYTLGRDYERLLLCVKTPDRRFCEHATQLADFAKLNPMARVLLESSIDWRALVTPGQYENPLFSTNDELSATNLANAALSAEYEDRKVATALLLGRAIEELYRLSIPSTTLTEPPSYRVAVTKSVNARLSDLGGTYVHQELPTNPPPDMFRVGRLENCLEDTWLPAASPSPTKTAATPTPDPCFP